MNDKEINLKLTAQEANMILGALGNIPYAQVFSLIAKIQEQAKPQVENAGV